MQRSILGDQGRTDLARGKGADLFVNRAHLGPFGIIQNRQVDRAGDVILGVFGGGAHIDDVVKTQREYLGQ